ncbi:MAG: hypothetical protein ABJC04_09900 [Verrucomicrobiota bacterium]
MEQWQKKVTDLKSSPIKKWSNYEGKGFEIEGKIQGIVRSQARIFTFEKGDNVCLITEYATVGDLKTFAADFAKIRQSFKLK